MAFLRRVVLAFAIVSIGSPSLRALTPESPEVKQGVALALGFLAKTNTAENVGEKSLVALCFLKSNAPEHPKIAEAVAFIEEKKTKLREVDNYALGLGIILLAEIGKPEHRTTLDTLMQELYYRQKPHGGWGYSGHGNGLEKATGDVSQTQYAALAMWSAKNAGLKIPQKNLDAMCNYMIRVQDPSGAWGYQGVDPGSSSRVSQGPGELSLSRAAAGLGSVAISADLLKLRAAPNAQMENQFSTALKEVEENPAAAGERVPSNVAPENLRRALTDGSEWLKKNFAVETHEWNMYYLYGLERAQSFMELYHNQFPPEPKWYSDGAAHILKRLGSGGSIAQGDQNPNVATSLATLFLLRSAKKAIAKAHKDLGEGLLTSGKGLPTDIANASIKRGKVVDSPLAGEVDDLVALLDDPENPEIARLLDSDSGIQLDADITKRAGQIAKLRAAVRAGNWEARLVAVKGLAKSRDLDVVPSLLYALSDPDLRVLKETDQALRFISRKFEGVGLPPEPSKRDFVAARAAWRAWYLSIRPDAKLLD